MSRRVRNEQWCSDGGNSGESRFPTLSKDGTIYLGYSLTDSLSVIVCEPYKITITFNLLYRFYM